MLLTDDLFDVGVKSKQICTIINDDYVLVSKSSPIPDDKLEKYVDNVRKAKASGINIASILDYRLIPGTTNCYGKDLCYTKTVFLEERAKGVSNDKKIYWLSSNSDYDISIVVEHYLEKVKQYIEELENRASVPISFYEKFIEDCIKLHEFNLQIDPKPLNFFFDKNIGYTIIDVVDYNGEVNVLPNGFAECLFEIVFGFGRTDLFVELKNVSYLPEEYYDRLYNVSKKLEAMLVKVLRKYNVEEDIIKAVVYKNSSKYSYFLPFLDKDEIEDVISKLFYSIKNDKKEAVNILKNVV